MIVRRSGSLQTKFPIGPKFSENHFSLFFGHLYPTVFYFSGYGVFSDNPPNPLTFSFSGLRHFDGRLRKKVPKNQKMIRPSFDYSRFLHSSSDVFLNEILEIFLLIWNLV